MRRSYCTATKQRSDAVALCRAERWCCVDDPGDVLGQALGGVVATKLVGVFGALGVVWPTAPVSFGTGDLGSTSSK